MATANTARAAKKHPIGPEDNWLLAHVGDPQISPDGTRVAYTVRTNDREKNERQTSVYVAPMDGGAPPRRFSYGTKDGSPRWSPDGRYLAFISGRNEKGQIYLAPLDGGEARELTKAPHGVNEIAWSPDGARIAYIARVGEWKEMKDRDASEKASPRVIKNLRYRLDTIGYFDDRRTHVFVVDVESGDTTQITDGDWYDQQIAWSPNGKTIVFTSDRGRQRHNRQFRGDVWVVAVAGGKARKLTRSRGPANFPSFSPDGRYVAFTGHERADAGFAVNHHVVIVEVSGTGAPRSVTASVDNTVSTVPQGKNYEWSRDGKSITFMVQERGTQALYRVGIAPGAKAKMVLDGERQVHQFAIAPDGKRIAFTASWASNPIDLYVATLGSDARERNVAKANAPLLAAADVGATRRMTHRAADGPEIESFVIYPPGYVKGRRYPLALYIHGGPHAQHPLLGFAMRPATLAGAGYVVLLPNPRGSTGYGEVFTQMCVRDWGGKDYEDIMGAVDALVAKGVADPERLYVTGYSYGGFMTAWTVGHTTRFKAAIIGAPVADHISMRGTTEIPQFSDFEVPTPWEDLDEAWERSPLKHLPQCTTPVLIEHHEGDLRCPIGQAEEIFQTLKMLGREVEFVRYPGGFHILEFHAPSQDMDYQRRQIAWFGGHGGKTRRGAKRRARPKASLNGANAPASTRERVITSTR
jgi:dipeptidyl aminopeptidase/acylaminoacyl peptidase